MYTAPWGPGSGFLPLRLDVWYGKYVSENSLKQIVCSLSQTYSHERMNLPPISDHELTETLPIIIISLDSLSSQENF